MKLAVCILIHHNPWLIMGSLISLAMQKNTNYDLHFINIRGTGECRDRKSYKKFHDLADQENINKANQQLSSDDKRIIDIITSLNINYTYHEFENDHGLDSGTWYKFIKKGVWKSYDYSFFLEEGFLFTRETVLDSFHVISGQKKIDFLDMGFGKRISHKSQIFKVFTSKSKPSELDYYKDESMRAVYSDFSQDEDFKKLIQEWPNEPLLKKNPIGTTYYHVPTSAYSFSEKLRLCIKQLYKYKNFHFYKRPLILQQPQAKLRSLKAITNDFQKINEVIYHKEKSPYFFGIYCQHLFSKEFLCKFEEKLEKYNLYKVLDYPISAGPLEPIWGLLPSWLGFDKWYFDGVHRVSKNFITLKREDDVSGVCKYINRYFKGKIKVMPDGDYIKIIKYNNKYKYAKNLLGNSFFSESINETN
jgi:hypothetical protein